MTIPSKSPITLAFGATTSPYTPSSPHKGTDFSYLPDNRIYAPFSGRVTLVPNNGNDGNGIYMTEPNGNFHGLLHSSKYLVSNGAQVDEGQPVAIMGDTGYAFGVHLHWCVKQNGKFIDPMSLIKEEEMVNKGDIFNVYRLAIGREPNANDIAAWDGKPWKDFIYDLLKRPDAVWNKPGSDAQATLNKIKELLK